MSDPIAALVVILFYAALLYASFVFVRKRAHPARPALKSWFYFLGMAIGFVLAAGILVWLIVGLFGIERGNEPATMGFAAMIFVALLYGARTAIENLKKPPNQNRKS